MILDERLEFANAQDISQVAGTYLSTNVVDLTTVRDIGQGQTWFLIISIIAAVVGTSSTVEFRLRSDSAAAIHATTSTAHWTSGAIPEATLVAGYTLVVPVPLEGNAYERYLGVQAIIAVATTTAGTFSANMSLDPYGWKAYPDATN